MPGHPVGEPGIIGAGGQAAAFVSQKILSISAM